VGRAKNELKPWLVKMWCIPPKANGEFVWKMQDVLEVYKRPYDPLRPVVCMDETSKQLIGETRFSVDAAPGQSQCVDYEYERKGVADLFMFFEPLRGWRRVWIAPQRRKAEGRCKRRLWFVIFIDKWHQIFIAIWHCAALGIRCRASAHFE